MLKKLALCAFVTVFGTLAFGATWSGQLVDASCYNQKKAVTQCSPTDSTSSFALDVSGKIYDLDAAGNAKAATALNSRANRSTNPNENEMEKASPVTATVTGTLKGHTITVKTIDVK